MIDWWDILWFSVGLLGIAGLVWANLAAAGAVPS